MFCEVILPLHLPQSFTYRIPQELCEYVKVGCRVAVQFGKKNLQWNSFGTTQQSSECL